VTLTLAQEDNQVGIDDTHESVQEDHHEDYVEGPAKPDGD